MGGGSALGLGTLLQGQAQGRQVSQRIGLGIELGLFGYRLAWRRSHLQLCSRSLDHRRHGFSLGLDQLRPRLRIGHLPSHQTGVEQGRVRQLRRFDLGAVLVFRQILAAVGNLRLVGGSVLAASCTSGGFLRHRRVFDAYSRLTRLLGIHIGKAGRLVVRGLQRFIRRTGSGARRLRHGTGLQQGVGGDRHVGVSATEVVNVN
ncbi:hypothetical protein D3C79_773720 [compost metagenome]